MKRGAFKFRLYVVEDTQNSKRAIGNLSALCREHLPGRHAIEVIDVFKAPKRAQADGVLMTPTLIKLWPAPVARIVGTLSLTPTVLEALGLASTARAT